MSIEYFSSVSDKQMIELMTRIRILGRIVNNGCNLSKWTLFNLLKICATAFSLTCAIFLILKLGSPSTIFQFHREFQKFALHLTRNFSTDGCILIFLPDEAATDRHSSIDRFSVQLSTVQSKGQLCHPIGFEISQTWFMTLSMSKWNHSKLVGGLFKVQEYF